MQIELRFLAAEIVEISLIGADIPAMKLPEKIRNERVSFPVRGDSIEGLRHAIDLISATVCSHFAHISGVAHPENDIHELVDARLRADIAEHYRLKNESPQSKRAWAMAVLVRQADRTTDEDFSSAVNALNELANEGDATARSFLLEEVPAIRKVRASSSQ